MTDSQTTADTVAGALTFTDELRKDYVDKTQLCAGIGISTRTLDPHGSTTRGAAAHQDPLPFRVARSMSSPATSSNCDSAARGLA